MPPSRAASSSFENRSNCLDYVPIPQVSRLTNDGSFFREAPAEAQSHQAQPQAEALSRIVHESKIRFNLHPLLPARGDPSLIRQVLIEILLVEDNPHDAELMTRELKKRQEEGTQGAGGLV
jgi:hypothetical protein